MIAQNTGRANNRGSRLRPAPVAVLVLAGLIAAISGCGSQEDAVNPQNSLCNGEADLGLKIEGRAQPVELCVDDADVSVFSTTGNHYDIATQVDVGGVVYQVQLLFTYRADAPVSLRIVDSIAEATNDPTTARLYLKEVPTGGDAVESGDVSGGTLHLGFNDASVVTGTLRDVSLAMHRVSDGQDAGTRTVPEGFFSLSVKNPATPAATARR